MPKKNPTNYDIYVKLGSIEEIALATKMQAEKTNGRVNKLEEWQSGIQAVDAYKRDHESAPITSGGTIDYTKIVLYALGLVGTALGILAVAIK